MKNKGDLGVLKSDLLKALGLPDPKVQEDGLGTEGLSKGPSEKMNAEMHDAVGLHEKIQGISEKLDKDRLFGEILAKPNGQAEEEFVGLVKSLFGKDKTRSIEMKGMKVSKLLKRMKKTARNKIAHIKRKMKRKLEALQKKSMVKKVTKRAVKKKDTKLKKISKGKEALKKTTGKKKEPLKKKRQEGVVDQLNAKEKNFLAPGESLNFNRELGLAQDAIGSKAKQTNQKGSGQSIGSNLLNLGTILKEAVKLKSTVGISEEIPQKGKGKGRYAN